MSNRYAETYATRCAFGFQPFGQPVEHTCAKLPVPSMASVPCNACFTQQVHESAACAKEFHGGFTGRHGGTVGGGPKLHIHNFQAVLSIDPITSDPPASRPQLCTVRGTHWSRRSHHDLWYSSPHSPRAARRTIPCTSNRVRSKSHRNGSSRRSPITVSFQALCCASKKASQ